MRDILTTPTTQKEISRLAQNSKILFDLLLDMLLLIKDDFVIERMNAAAIAGFGNHQRQKCHQAITGLDSPCEAKFCPVSCSKNQKQCGQIIERKLNDNFYVEYSHVPFEGYNQDKLVLVIIRDITKKKQYELELEQYSKNIEKVLQEKIANLQESELERQQ